MTVTQYGLHKDNDGVWWLLQETVPSNAIGLPSNLCELQVPTYLGKCIHQIDLERHSIPDDGWLIASHNPVMEFFAPLPKDQNRLAYMPIRMSEMEQRISQFAKLQMMFSPLRDMMTPVWVDKAAAAWIKMRSNTNLATVVVFGDLIRHSSVVERLKQLSYQFGSRILFVGPDRPDDYGMSPLPLLDSSHLKELEELEIFNRPADDFRSFGAHLLREAMRNDGKRMDS